MGIIKSITKRSSSPAKKQQAWTAQTARSHIPQRYATRHKAIRDEYEK